jgi:hypothetical protein
MYIYICICICMYMYVYIYTRYIYIYIYIYVAIATLKECLCNTCYARTCLNSNRHIAVSSNRYMSNCLHRICYVCNCLHAIAYMLCKHFALLCFDLLGRQRAFLRRSKTQNSEALYQAGGRCSQRCSLRQTTIAFLIKAILLMPHSTLAGCRAAALY